MQIKYYIKKLLILVLIGIASTKIFAQKQDKISGYFFVDYNKIIYDRTDGNNPWNIGLGAQVFLNINSKFKPTIELTANASLEDDKLLRLTRDEKPVNDARGVINLFAGTSFQPAKKFYLSFMLGPGFINDNVYFGIKPSFGFYFSNRQRVTLRFSYINIFNRELNYQETKKDDFGSVGFAIGVKLF